MRPLAASIYRVSSRVIFLTVALVVALVLWYLPALLNLDSFRPQVTQVLESTFHSKVIIGRMTAQLIPTPGLVIAPVVLLENTKEPRPLASVRVVHLYLPILPLLKGHLNIHTIRFIRPRFIAHRILTSTGQSRWVMLTLPKATSSNDSVGVDQWEIRNGAIEIWDETHHPVTKWVADDLGGSFLVRKQTGSLGGKTTQLGPHALVNVRFNAAAPYPVQAQLSDLDLQTLQFLLPGKFLTLNGTADLHVQTRFVPSTTIRAQIHQVGGVGDIEATVKHSVSGQWQWSAEGKHGTLTGTPYEVPQWSAKEDREGLAIYVRGETRQGGIVEMGWTQAPHAAAALDVNVSSVTIHQLFQLFRTTSTASAPYEAWHIQQGSLQGLLAGTTSFVIQDSDIDLEDTHIDLAGSFNLSAGNSSAKLQGDWTNVSLDWLATSFFPGTDTLDGNAKFDFNLAFPMTKEWTKGLNGSVHLNAKDGVLKTLKTFYRVSAILNLGNYLRLRFPDVTANGIEFDDLSGNFVLQNGILSTEDLFLKSPNMNVGATGNLDLPGKQIDVKLRVELFRFLEDILKVVPITHWIFKKPNKIFMPLVVSLEGSLNDPDIR